ncbi:family 43 glycosylhydrolase [Zobellia alginiliquefaciens]|uniref:family 43 glycosylhydrolase n=1 Tax=Zobellia alginiliquefaciens TaxID=3032586 RepID=UPI0023E44407|nr:family 43 glycosylhydrolase [Zobellia alginiliquefaciens]
MKLINQNSLGYFKTFMAIALISLVSCKSKNENKSIETSSVKPSNSNFYNFTYQEIKGIGPDSTYNRRDNSDIIKVGDTYYVWYSRMDSPVTSGYWATIWYATSKDEGYTWQEQGMALDIGKKGGFDSHSVFTPNILVYNGKYYLYYTGVQPTPGNPNNEFEGNHTTDFTAIGLAVSDSPEGPFKRVENNPVLTVSETPEDFDSYRIDDASMLVKDNKIWLFYKGRSIVDGAKGPGLTEMSVAYAEKPEGPFIKHKGSLLDKSHEVLIWKNNTNIAALTSISKSIYSADDGIHFSILQDSLTHIPKAPGLYRPDLEDGNTATETPGWGIAMKGKKGQVHLVRFEMNK